MCFRNTQQVYGLLRHAISNILGIQNVIRPENYEVSLLTCFVDTSFIISSNNNRLCSLMFTCFNILGVLLVLGGFDFINLRVGQFLLSFVKEDNFNSRVVYFSNYGWCITEHIVRM